MLAQNAHIACDDVGLAGRNQPAAPAAAGEAAGRGRPPAGTYSRSVGQAHAGLSEVALKLRLGLPPKTPALKTAIKAERVAFNLKRSLQQLEVKDVETITRRAPVLPEVRRGGKVVDPESLLRHENRHAERLTGLPRRNTPRRSG